MAATRRRNQRRWADSAYRERSKAWQRERRARLGSTRDLQRSRARLQRIVDEWKARGCVDCGFGDIRAIDPDHPPGVKTGNISRMVQLCVAADRLRAELSMCEPRCAVCHRIKTAAERPSTWRARSNLPPSWQRRLEMQDLNSALKVARGCVDCGYAAHPRALDWDHIPADGVLKASSVASLIANGRPWVEVLGEIAKCDVRCANCHRIATAERLAVAAPQDRGRGTN